MTLYNNQATCYKNDQFLKYRCFLKTKNVPSETHLHFTAVIHKRPNKIHILTNLIVYKVNSICFLVGRYACFLLMQLI